MGGVVKKFCFVPTTEIFMDLYRFFTRARTKGSQGFDPKGGDTVMYHIDARHAPTISDHAPTTLRPLVTPMDTYCLLVPFIFPFVVYLHPTLWIPSASDLIRP